MDETTAVRTLAAVVDTRDDEEALRAGSVDSGRILVRRPRAIAAPRTAQDVLEIVRWANRTGSSVALRGMGHTQAGQSLTDGGVQIDMRGLDRIGPLDDERRTLWVQAGATWRQVVGYVRPRGWMPLVLTNNLDTTVGGTLSTGGVGQSSHRYGTQANNVDELEVVTGDGRLLHCSATENAPLFDATRAGLGQFSLITRAHLRGAGASTLDDAMVTAPDSGTPWNALAGADRASFADILRELRPLFPASLLDGEGWTRMLDRATELPAAAAVFFGFEFRLGHPDPSADVCVPLAAGIGAPAALESPVARSFIRKARNGARLQPSRAALARCIGGFGRADSMLARWAESALLEYDVAGPGAAGRSTPGIYFRLRREPGPAGHDVRENARRDIASTLTRASGWSADLAERREVERAFDALPPGARVAQAGAMPDRTGRAIRLVARDIDADAVPDFLARLRWPGRIASASAVLTDLLEVGPRFALSFDMTARAWVRASGWRSTRAGAATGRKPSVATGNRAWPGWWRGAGVPRRRRRG